MPRSILIIPLILVACTSTVENKRLSEDCFLKPETGHCRAAIQKHYFDETHQQCRQFIWGDCGGVVPFDTKQECDTECSSTTETSHLTQLDLSLSHWQKVKLENGNTYQYSTRFSSWVGFGNETSISVVNGVVANRSYRSWDDKQSDITQWSESTVESLNSHRDGASAKTLDELYDDCQDILQSKDNENNRINLGFDNNGIIQTCLFTPKNCADDCSSGVRVDSLIFSD